MKKFYISLIAVTALSWGSVPNAAALYSPAEADLGRIVVTATRIAQHDYKIAGNVTVIDQDQIAASNAQSIPGILKEALGVNIYNSSTTKSSTVDIRGFGDTAGRNVLVLVNDRKVNPVDISGPDLVQLPLGAVEKIEVIRGAGSVLYGDNAVGGVVNIITKHGQGDLQGKVGYHHGSYDAQGADLEVSGAKNRVHYYVYSQYDDQKGYRSNSDMLAKDFNTRVGYRLTDKIAMDLTVNWHEDDQGLPGGLNAGELASLGRRGSANEGDYSSTKDRSVQLSLDLDPWPEDVYFGELAVDLFYRNRDTYALFNAFNFGTKREIDSKGVSVKYIFDRTIFDQEVNFVTGVDYFDDENDILGSGSNTDDLIISKEEWGLYGYLEYEMLDDVYFNAGSRYHKARYTFSEADSTTFERKRPDETVYMGGLKYEYAQGSNVHMNVQKTFRFLATDEWYSSWSGLNTDLDQQSGIQYELGVKHNFDDKAVVNITPYWIDLKDEIFFDPESGFFGANENYDKTRRIGVEVGARFDLLAWMDLDFLDGAEFFTNYTFQNARFNGGANDDKRIPMVPRHQANCGLVVTVWDHINTSVTGRYVGARYAVNDTLNNTPAEKPYYVLDGRVAYRQDLFEVYAEINNILDEKYSPLVTKAASSTTKDYFPAPERNFTVGVNVRF
jgi:iron complex outermembrane receptor protein